MEKKIASWIKAEATDIELMELVNSINSWNGELEEYHFYYMDELDDLFYGVKPTKLLSKLADDFNKNAEGFRDTVFGLESCALEDVADEVRHNAEDVAENVINNLDCFCTLGHESLPESLKNYLEEE